MEGEKAYPPTMLVER